MPALSTRLARPLAAASLLALAGCGIPEANQFAPPCPQPSIPRDLGDLHIFRGSGRDITDNVLDGRITAISGSCTRDTAATTVVTMSVNLTLTRGPANTSRTTDVAYFVAVSDGETILDKRIYNLQAVFPPNTERLGLEGDVIELRLPVTAKKTAAAYRVSVGFQLTPAELQINRARNGR